MDKFLYVVAGVFTVSVVILLYKLNTANSSFETYIEESSKPVSVYQCLYRNCFEESFLNSGKFNTRRVLLVKPAAACAGCNEQFEQELESRINALHHWEIITKRDTQLDGIFEGHHFQFQHVTLIALDRYKTHYVYEYHPDFPLKDAKTTAFLTFLHQSDN